MLRYRVILWAGGGELLSRIRLAFLEAVRRPFPPYRDVIWLSGGMTLGYLAVIIGSVWKNTSSPVKPSCYCAGTDVFLEPPLLYMIMLFCCKAP